MGVCAPLCLADADCPAGQVCRLGLCTEGGEPPGGDPRCGERETYLQALYDPASGYLPEETSPGGGGTSGARAVRGPGRIAPWALLIGLIALLDRWTASTLQGRGQSWLDAALRVGLIAAGGYWAWRGESGWDTGLRFAWLGLLPELSIAAAIARLE